MEKPLGLIYLAGEVIKMFKIKNIETSINPECYVNIKDALRELKKFERKYPGIYAIFRTCVKCGIEKQINQKFGLGAATCKKCNNEKNMVMIIEKRNEFKMCEYEKGK